MMKFLKHDIKIKYSISVKLLFVYSFNNLPLGLIFSLYLLSLLDVEVKKYLVYEFFI